MPDPQLAWAAWQTAFGLGPASEERLQGALLKHVREAGLHTSWTEQDPAYERAVAGFVGAGPGRRPAHGRRSGTAWSLMRGPTSWAPPWST